MPSFFAMTISLRSVFFIAKRQELLYNSIDIDIYNPEVLLCILSKF